MGSWSEIANSASAAGPYSDASAVAAGCVPAGEGGGQGIPSLYPSSFPSVGVFGHPKHWRTVFDHLTRWGAMAIYGGRVRRKQLAVSMPLSSAQRSTSCYSALVFPRVPRQNGPVSRRGAGLTPERIRCTYISSVCAASTTGLLCDNDGGVAVLVGRHRLPLTGSTCMGGYASPERALCMHTKDTYIETRSYLPTYIHIGFLTPA